jgi:Signal transduction histidine kinase
MLPQLRIIQDIHELPYQRPVMRHIKFTLACSLLLFVGVSMAVTNFVILPFWAGDILVRESRSLQRFLAASIPTREQAARFPPPAVQSFLTENPESCIHWQTAMQSPSPASGSSCQQGLAPLLAAAVRTGTPHSSLTDITLADLFGPTYLSVALPDGQGGGIGAAVPLANLLRPLWTKEQVIAVYLLFNAVVLSVLAFFRFLRAYVRPIDRMVYSVENYQGDGPQGLHGLFVEQSVNELGRLSGSIEAMVRRIEADREKLATAVAELATKNTLLQANQREMIRTEKLAAVGKLAAGLAHEIGNPLSVAQGYLQLFGMDNCTEQERNEYVGKTVLELERMDRLIRRLLNYARSGQGALTRLDAHALLAEIVDDLTGQPFLKEIDLAFTPQAQDSTVLVDGEQLRQVVLNCVINAVDAIDGIGRRSSGTITIATARQTAPDEDSSLCITIGDNGGGIPDALVDAVFDPFFTTKEVGAGTGLGLSVSLALVESMHGSMELRSRAGDGTTVHIVLPLVAGAGADEKDVC